MKFFNKTFWKFTGGFILIVLLGLIIVAALQYYQTKQNPGNQTQKPDEIVVTDLPDGEKLVENKTWSSSVKLPVGWTIDITKSQFYSPDSNCKISSSFSKNINNENLNELESSHDKDLLDIGFTVKEKNYQIIKVAGFDSLKMILSTEETGYSITVEIPVLDKIYNYILYSDINNKEKCDSYFDKFLQTVSINK